MSKLIPLRGKNGEGKFAIVDDHWFEYLLQFNWRLNSNNYIVRSVWNKESKQTTIVYMHREILGLKFGDRENVDHINHLRYDNRIENLRVCNNQQNCHNTTSRGGVSQYKGVRIGGQKSRWVANITVSGIHINLGSYLIEKDAALAYDEAARKYFGEFAYLNFPDITDYSNIKRICRKNHSKFPGVSFHIRQQKWIAFTKINNKTKTIGNFQTEIEAHQAREKYIKENSL